MHVLLDAHLAVKKIDGVARHIRGLLSELPALDRSIRYTVLTLPAGKSCLPPTLAEQPNVSLGELDLRGPSPRQNLIMPRLIREIKPDLYHHPQYDLPLTIRIPRVVTFHDLKYLFRPDFLEGNSFLKRSYIRWSIAHSLRSADQIISVSENTLKDLGKLFTFQDSKVSVIPNGVEPILGDKSSESANKITLPERYILFVGTRRPHKNINGLIHALKVVRVKFDLPIELVIAGKAYADYRDPEKTASDTGMTNFVHFKNFVSDAQLPRLYRKAEAFVLPSFYEGFGIPLIEAMANKTPVIGSDRSSIPEVIGSAGLLVNPERPDDIADKIFQICTDQRLRQRLIDAGLERSRQFSWKRIAEATLEVYIKALRKRCRERV
jgi:glycosyltransferase involved in cell wall biosynthesis